MRRFVSGRIIAEILVGPGLQHDFEFRAWGRKIKAIRPAVMLSLLDRVDLLIRLEDVRQIPRILALQESVARVGKAGMHGKRHRVTKPARVNLARRVWI